MEWLSTGQSVAYGHVKIVRMLLTSPPFSQHSILPYTYLSAEATNEDIWATESFGAAWKGKIGGGGIAKWAAPATAMVFQPLFLSSKQV